MGDYSFVETQDGEIVGMWIGDSRIIKRKHLIQMLLAKHQLLDMLERFSSGRYRVVPNTYDNKGGCFLMFGSSIAPGE